MVYMFVVSGECRPWVVNDVTYSFYAIDFSVGFCSRVIQGALYNLFVDTPDMFSVSVYLTIIFVVTSALIAYILGKIITQLEPTYRKTAIIIFLFLLTGPCTFGMYLKIFGLIDFFWVSATVLSLLCLQKKQLYFLVVPLAVFMVLVYYGAILCYVPFLAIVLLYKISCSQDKKEKRYLTAVFFAMVVTTVFFTVYFVAFERSNLVFTQEEFDNFLISRGVDEGNLYYYDFSYYRYTESFMDNNDMYLPDSVEGTSLSTFIMLVFQQIYVGIFLKNFTYVTPLVLIIIMPVVIYIYRVLVKAMKNAGKNHLKKFALFCAMVFFPFVLVAGCCFSTDVVRWISNAFLPFFALGIYVVYKEKNYLWEIVNNDFTSMHTGALLPYFVVYAMSTFLPDAQ